MIDKELIKIAANTENFGLIDKYTHFSKLKNPICGDEMKIYLIVEKDKIAKFKYQSQSCIFCQASVSLLSRKTTSKSVEKVKNFLQKADNYFKQRKHIFDKEWQEFDKIMTKNNIARKECLLLPFKAMLNALNS